MTETHNPCHSESGSCQNMEKCFEMLQMYLDGEFKDLQPEFIQKMEKCLSCFEHYNLEKCIKENIRKKLAEHEVPEDLCRCIQEKLAQNRF